MIDDETMRLVMSAQDAMHAAVDSTTCPGCQAKIIALFRADLSNQVAFNELLDCLDETEVPHED